MYFVYAIKSKTRPYIYVGLTNDVERRIRQHNEGGERTTWAYRPFNLLHLEHFPDRMQAREREKYLKSGIGKEYLKSIDN